MWDWNAAFDKTLKIFKINAKNLADASGLSRPLISRFRNGKQPTTTDSLAAMLPNMPPEAVNYLFVSLLASGGVRPKDFINQQTEGLTALELLEILILLSKKINAEKITILNGEVAILGDIDSPLDKSGLYYGSSKDKDTMGKIFRSKEQPLDIVKEPTPLINIESPDDSGDPDIS